MLEERLLCAHDLHSTGRHLCQTGESAGPRDEPCCQDGASQVGEIGGQSLHSGGDVSLGGYPRLSQAQDRFCQEPHIFVFF